MMLLYFVLLQYTQSQHKTINFKSIFEKKVKK